jgi:hypothetical protein
MAEWQKGHFAEVVQLVEQSAHDPKVEGSNPAPAWRLEMAERLENFLLALTVEVLCLKVRLEPTRVHVPH